MGYFELLILVPLGGSLNEAADWSHRASCTLKSTVKGRSASIVTFFSFSFRLRITVGLVYLRAWVTLHSNVQSAIPKPLVYDELIIKFILRPVEDHTEII